MLKKLREDVEVHLEVDDTAALCIDGGDLRWEVWWQSVCSYVLGGVKVLQCY